MSLKALLNQPGTLENPSGAADRYGQPYFSAPVAVLCRFEQITKTVLNSKGESQPIDGRTFIAPDTVPAIEARFTFNGAHYRVMTVAPLVDGRGRIRHYEVMLQVWR